MNIKNKIEELWTREIFFTFSYKVDVKNNYIHI